MRIATEPSGPAIFRGDQRVLTHNLTAIGPTPLTNFIHPLTSPTGIRITEIAPADHAHHRGVFWAWRRVLVDGAEVDSWTGENFAYGLVESGAAASRNRATLTTELNWLALQGGRQTRVVRERTMIGVYDDGDTRHLDIQIQLRALVANVSIAGSDNEKGYGGPTLRFAHADRVRIAGEGREIEPTLGPVETGAAVDFVWTPRPEGFPRRVSARCVVDGRPWTQWVLRHGPGMQNAAFPGRTPHEIPTDRDLTIGFSLEIEA